MVAILKKVMITITKTLTYVYHNCIFPCNTRISSLVPVAKLTVPLVKGWVKNGEA